MSRLRDYLVDLLTPKVGAAFAVAILVIIARRNAIILGDFLTRIMIAKCRQNAGELRIICKSSKERSARCEYLIYNIAKFAALDAKFAALSRIAAGITLN